MTSTTSGWSRSSRFFLFAGVGLALVAFVIEPRIDLARHSHRDLSGEESLALSPLGSIAAAAFEPAPQQKQQSPKPSPQPYTGFWQEGEEFVYEVSYLFIKLGTITSRIVAVDRSGEKAEMKAEAFIKSYSGIPFTTINTVFYSTMNERMTSTSFAAREWYKDTTWKYMNYTYDRKKDKLYFSERLGKQKILDHYDTLKLDGKEWQDGLSLLFYARAFTFAKHEIRVPTLIYRTKADTYIRFGRERTSQEIDAVDYPVDVIKLDGEAGFTGIFGLTGGFRGWFSNDSACVPIYAQMRVIVGNVNIELIKWKRHGWKPPKAK